MVLPYGENCILITSSVFQCVTHVTDGQTDRWAIAYSMLSIYSAKYKLEWFTLFSRSSLSQASKQGTVKILGQTDQGWQVFARRQK